MSDLLENFLNGKWTAGLGSGVALTDPLTGTELARVSSDGLDLAAGFDYARETGGRALRDMSFGQRAAALAACVAVLKANRDRYSDIALANSGTTKSDSSTDIDGAIFTLNYYAAAQELIGTKALSWNY